MTAHSPEPHDAGTLTEVERIRALVMNIHGMLQSTQGAHLVGSPIEAIHRSLDRIEEAAQRRRPPSPAAQVSLPQH